jgi:hypothetical protein
MPQALVPNVGDEDISIPRRIGRVLGYALGRTRERNPGRVLEYARRQTREAINQRRRARARRAAALGR